jgi:hypothetical protein
MAHDHLGEAAQKDLADIVGYLNFSSGVPDARFLGGLDRLFAALDQEVSDTPLWKRVEAAILKSVDDLRGSSEAFENLDQARNVAELVFSQALPAYRQHHRDLLMHASDEALFQPFFVGRVCEALLAEGGPWNEAERIVDGALKRLNDFVGHRPVAVLRNGRKLQPYPHERVRPIPLYIEQVGVAHGRYHTLIRTALEILKETDPDLLEQAWFNPEQLEELSLDPRAFDFDHPVHRRPNYHFGTWDPHVIDNRGYYRRFVLQQVTVDALLARVDEASDALRGELLFEAAGVLAGTVLMGSGVIGDRPEAHDSSTSLATLLPHIAAYRDEFYEQLMSRLPAAHGKRLREEARTLRQPFAGARHDLNHRLAQQRARQLQHVHLSRLYARIGYTRAASEQARIVPVVSARMTCEIDCRLTAAHLAADKGRLEEAAGRIPEIEDLLHRAIECGALADPWNILGFGGQFSLFPAIENTIHDHRIDDLIDLINDIFDLYARLEKEAAAAGNMELQRRLSAHLELLAGWWDQFASTEVSEVDGISGREMSESADQVATALAAWHEAGTAAGDVAFWQRHVEHFRSPKAYALVVESLLEKGDMVASMGLLMHWLNSATDVPLAESDYSFHLLAPQWMGQLWYGGKTDKEPGLEESQKAWQTSRKFFDYLEANAQEYWSVPHLDLLEAHMRTEEQEKPTAEEDEDEDNEGGLFSAAYENVSYRDTTDDGFDSEMLDSGESISDYELTAEADRIADRLAFHVTLASLWKMAAVAPAEGAPGRDEVLTGWLEQAEANRARLLELLRMAHRYQIPSPRGTHESLVEFDQRRSVKEFLLDRIISACVETADASRLLAAAIGQETSTLKLAPWEEQAYSVLRALYRGDYPGVKSLWLPLLEALAEEPLLYVPTARGGIPQNIFSSRSLQRMLVRFLDHLPRMGLITETFQLLKTIHHMERSHPVGPGGITEFDRLFDIGCRGIVRCIVLSSAKWPVAGAKQESAREKRLIDCLEKVAEMLLRRWLAHSRAIRISVLETLGREERWESLKQFIQSYGDDLFTQQFMNLGNLRAILQQGADEYIAALEEEEISLRLLDDLDERIGRQEAVRHLELTIEAVVENYSVYVDYNSTTTQSDHGELLYTLLDFLRLLASYDRVAWNLRPIVLAHDVLIREGRDGAATLWREAVLKRSEAVADQNLQRYERLVSRYGMRLSSVEERLGERYIRPLEIDRLRALVRPAMEEVNDSGSSAAFDVLDREVARFTAEPGGVGFEVPPWIDALEEEVERARQGETDDVPVLDAAPQIEQVLLSLDEIMIQLDVWQQLLD